MLSPRTNHLAATAALLGAGALMWALGGQRLAGDQALRFKPNPLGLKMSAYGQVIGMAMQGPIDLFWHAGEDDEHDHDHDHEHVAAGHGHDDSCDDCGGHGDDHAADCPTAPAPASAPANLRERAKRHLAALGAAANRRTNPHAATTAHRFTMRRQIENRLRIAYEFDPSNFGTYNAYHLFLTESSLGTRGQNLDQVIHLARLTIDYCLRDQHDPRPSLTAAAAAHNILMVMFTHQKDRPREEFDTALEMLDTALARHLRLLRDRAADQSIALISPLRMAEMQERLWFTLRLRDITDATIRRMFGEPDPRHAAAESTPNPSTR